MSSKRPFLLRESLCSAGHIGGINLTDVIVAEPENVANVREFMLVVFPEITLCVTVFDNEADGEHWAPPVEQNAYTSRAEAARTARAGNC
jgi:hypothetical protein